MSANSEIELIFVTLLIVFGLGIALIGVNDSVIEKRVRTLWRIEAKLDLLLKHAGIKFDPYRNLPDEVVDAIGRGERLRAIMYYRNASGAGLKEARDFIDEAQRRVHLS
jgi:hypothetical protein